MGQELAERYGDQWQATLDEFAFPFRREHDEFTSRRAERGKRLGNQLIAVRRPDLDMVADLKVHAMPVGDRQSQSM